MHCISPNNLCELHGHKFTRPWITIACTQNRCRPSLANSTIGMPKPTHIHAIAKTNTYAQAGTPYIHIYIYRYIYAFISIYKWVHKCKLSKYIIETRRNIWRILLLLLLFCEPHKDKFVQHASYIINTFLAIYTRMSR